LPNERALKGDDMLVYLITVIVAIFLYLCYSITLESKLDKNGFGLVNFGFVTETINLTKTIMWLLIPFLNVLFTITLVLSAISLDKDSMKKLQEQGFVYEFDE